ncbi:hypothetical protein [Paraburkholderia sp. MM5384-R2]|uniref:hypothetical protein n=1 Tax=Paraburkholderia sp. MM5384-R2 TaxID=2723097 RepID=UPI00160BA34F|nr:hypothetical protein [Paraburkholderia sp. MM5384-R2]MBB5498287.1 hypothetical protein [Paraburkholderia sp. MM5384-R2]
MTAEIIPSARNFNEAPKHDYPSSQVAIERNQKRFHSAETYWASKQQSMQYSKSNGRA